MRPLQVSRYLRQFPSPRSPNWSLLRQACLNSPQTSLRAGLWQVSLYRRQFPSPRSPRASLFSQARRNCSHCPPLDRRTLAPLPVQPQWIGKRPRSELQKELSPPQRRTHSRASLSTFSLILQLLRTGLRGNFRWTTRVMRCRQTYAETVGIVPTGAWLITRYVACIRNFWPDWSLNGVGREDLGGSPGRHVAVFRTETVSRRIMKRSLFFVVIACLAAGF